MIVVYQFGPAWGMPCISPYVSKLVFYLQLAGIPYRLEKLDLARLDDDAPRGKLPYAVLDDGTVMPDSTEIINFLERSGRGQLDHRLSEAKRADMLAWTRLSDEHLYWSGVIEPRWRTRAHFEAYIPYLAGGETLTTETRDALEAFRTRVLSEFDGHGMGRRSPEAVLAAFCSDIDAIKARLQAAPFLMGRQVRSGDAGLYSMLSHIIDAPFDWPGRTYARQIPILQEYLARMRGLLAPLQRHAA
jgi:glutathione S-transferase